MLKKLLSAIIISLLFNLIAAPSVLATGKTEKEAKFTEEVKNGIAKLGTGRDAKLKLKLKDGTKIKGYISEIGNDSFKVQNEKTGESVSIGYSQVKQAKGNNLSKKTAIILGFAALFTVLIIVLVAQKDNT